MTDSWSTEDADRAVATLAVFIEHGGGLPQALIDAYKSAIDSGDIGVTRHFFEQLALKCPDAIDYFTESTAERLAEAGDDAEEHPKLREIPID